MENRLGELFTPMLVAMTDRGPDSAGFAIYGDEVADDWVKLTLRHPDPNYGWQELAERARSALAVDVKMVFTLDQRFSIMSRKK